MASKWPFMANLSPNAQIRFLDHEPLDLPPPPGFLPERVEHPAHCPFDHGTPGRVPVEIKSINGVEQRPRSTFMFLRPVTLEKITAAIRASKEAPLEPSE